MAHISKYTKTVIGHMTNHYGRQENDGVKRGNENINPELTHLNYNLAADTQPLAQLDFLHKRLSEVKVQNRKDVNVLCDWVLTVPKELPAQAQEQFFKASYEFMSARYGSENIVSAFVHMDETTPHMHFAFIPVTADKKKGGFKVSAKEVVTRSDLQTFHSDLEEYLYKNIGLERGLILSGITQEQGGNKTVKELKSDRTQIEKEIAHKEELLTNLITQHKEITEVYDEELPEGKKTPVGVIFTNHQWKTLLNIINGLKSKLGAYITKLNSISRELSELKLQNERIKVALAEEKAKNKNLISRMSLKHIRKIEAENRDLNSENKRLQSEKERMLQQKERTFKAIADEFNTPIENIKKIDETVNPSIALHKWRKEHGDLIIKF